MKTISSVITALIVIAWAGSAARGEEDPKQEAARKEIRAVQREMDKFYTRCKYCDGKGKQGERVCRECDGDGRVFDGDHQAFLDKYLDMCDLMERNADAATGDDRSAKRLVENRDFYLRTIRSHAGPQEKRRRISSGAEAGYRHGEKYDGAYNLLARGLTGAQRGTPTGHGIAFEAKVVRIISKDDRQLAEVRIQAVKFSSRTCFVFVPKDATWKADGAVRVVGRVLDGTAERTAFELDEDALVIQPYYGTE